MRKGLILIILVSSIVFYACRHLPPTADQTVIGNINSGSSFCFTTDILPIFQAKCATSGCHDAVTQANGYWLDSYDHIMLKDVNPFNATSSKVFESFDTTFNHLRHMPPLGTLQLNDNEKSWIGRWINQGAQNTTQCGCASPSDSNLFAYTANIKPILNICISCHRPPTPPNGWDLTSYDPLHTIAINGLLVKVVTHDPGITSWMPLNLPMLSACNITQIKKWVAAGAPNN